jgi:hypothetical protein
VGKQCRRACNLLKGLRYRGRLGIGRGRPARFPACRWISPKTRRSTHRQLSHYVEGTTEQPDKDRKYVLTAAQAEALRDALDAVLRELETQQERSVKGSAPNSAGPAPTGSRPGLRRK